jgi:hypothetical protein
LRRDAATSTQSNDSRQDTDVLNIQATGLAPGNPLESALIATLGPGNDTAIIRGVNNGAGVGLAYIGQCTTKYHYEYFDQGPQQTERGTTWPRHRAVASRLDSTGSRC